MTLLTLANVSGLPALSIRQPWAWAVIHAGKNIENRSVFSASRMDLRKGRTIAIHAAKGMTRDEYEDAADFMAHIGVDCPPPADLLRGGIIGVARIDGVVKKSMS